MHFNLSSVIAGTHFVSL